MAIVSMQLTFDNINVSAQVGDIVYYTHSGNTAGGFNQEKAELFSVGSEIVESSK